MDKCTDPETGALLHAFEIDILPDEAVERFETHVLSCDYCFNRMKAFMQGAALLNTDEDVRAPILQADFDKYLSSESALQKFRRYIWPDAPLVFKPALAYLLVLLMVYPVYLGIKKSAGTDVRGVQELIASNAQSPGIRNNIGMIQKITLSSGRSLKESVFKINAGVDGLIHFVYEDAEEGADYSIFIESDDGNLLFHTEVFNTFDEYGSGSLKYPLEAMIPGDYWLKIVDPRAEPPFNTRRYPFRVKK